MHVNRKGTGSLAVTLLHPRTPVSRGLLPSPRLPSPPLLGNRTYRSVTSVGHSWFPFVGVLEGGRLVGARGHLGRLLPLLQERLRRDNGVVGQ